MCDISDYFNKSLENDEIIRYSRHMLVPGFGGGHGQRKMKNSKVLLIGAGGLGCPVSFNLVASGIGNLGIVDYDVVEVHNLIRQNIYNTEDIGKYKVECMSDALRKVNEHVKIDCYNILLSEDNIESIIKNYELIVDCTDNMPTRYLINEASVRFNKVLISAAATGWEGQLTVYNYKNGPCMRCIFPQSPDPSTVVSCDEGGIINSVTNIIGGLQALEVQKIILDKEDILGGKMLIFDGRDSSFKKIRLRNRSVECFCSTKSKDLEILYKKEMCLNQSRDLFKFYRQLSVHEYHEILKNEVYHLLIDVRENHEYSICNFKNSINIPYLTLFSKSFSIEKFKDCFKNNNNSLLVSRDHLLVIVHCQKGNLSSKAFPKLYEYLGQLINNFTLKNLVGGLQDWHNSIDKRFPSY